MRQPIVFGVVLIIAIGFDAFGSSSILADEGVDSPAAVAEVSESVEEKSPEQYLVTVAQHQLNDNSLSDLTSAGILAAIKDQNASPVETISLSATAGNETRASFGRSVSVTTGKVVARGGAVSRNHQRRDLGTILNVKLTPEEANVSLELSFESSRLVGEAAKDSPPDVASTSLAFSQVFTLGQPTLIAASTGGESIYVVLTIVRR